MQTTILINKTYDWVLRHPESLKNIDGWLLSSPLQARTTSYFSFSSVKLEKHAFFFLNSRLKYIRTYGVLNAHYPQLTLFYISVRYLQQFQIGLYMYMGPASRNIKFLIIIFVEHRKSLTNFVLHCIFIIYTTSKINMHVSILINVK